MVVQLVDNKRWEYAADLYSKDYMTKAPIQGESLTCHAT